MQKEVDSKKHPPYRPDWNTECICHTRKARMGHVTCPVQIHKTEKPFWKRNIEKKERHPNRKGLGRKR